MFEETFGEHRSRMAICPSAEKSNPAGSHGVGNKWGHTLIRDCVAAAYR